MHSKKEKLPLSVTHPELAAEAEGWDPSSYTYGSGRVVQWKCPGGHTYQTSIDKRTLRKHSCPICSGHQVLVGFNDLATTHPELAAEAFDWNPQEYSRGSEYNATWKCKYGHTWEALVINRVKLNQGCAVCANKKIIVGFNDLLTTNPLVASEAIGWDPRQIVAGSERRKEWRCINNHTWFASPKSRTRTGTRTGSGCPTCANSGFDPSLPAYLYFLEQEEWEMFQIGITNDFKRRLVEHSRNGWREREVRGPMDGHLTQQWETAILRMLKAKGADLSNAKIAGKFDGYSEAWSKSTFDVKTIKELMRLTEEFEKSAPL